MTIHELTELESLSIFQTRAHENYACGAFDRVNFHHEPSPLNLLLLYLLRELLVCLKKVI